MMHGRNGSSKLHSHGRSESLEWEVRPGGMLVQRRDYFSAPSPCSGPQLRLSILFGPRHYNVTIASEATFGELKRTLAPITGLHPREQRLLFQGKERDDSDCLHIAGVCDMSRISLVEEMRGSGNFAKGYQNVAHIREEVNKLARQVYLLESKMNGCNRVAESQFSTLSELLMRQLLELDGVEAEGEAKIQRKHEVRRIQNLTDKVDRLKLQNDNPFNSNSLTQWETFGSGAGSLVAPQSSVSTNRGHF